MDVRWAAMHCNVKTLARGRLGGPSHRRVSVAIFARLNYLEGMSQRAGVNIKTTKGACGGVRRINDEVGGFGHRHTYGRRKVWEGNDPSSGFRLAESVK